MPQTPNPTSVPSEDTIIPWTPPPRKKILDPRMMIAVYFYRNHFTTICYIEIQ